MNINKLTERSLEALQAAQSTAIEHKNPQVDEEHLLYALLTQENSLAESLIEKMGLNASAFKASAEQALLNLPTISGTSVNASPYISAELDKVLNTADKQAQRMKDEYISVEHLFLGLIDNPNDALKRIFKEYGIKQNEFLKALNEIRGAARVTTQTPEDTYDALGKYAQDLVELARKNKLDPVIGRDDEVRNVIRILSRKTKNNPVLIGEPGVGKNRHCRGIGAKNSSR